MAGSPSYAELAVVVDHQPGLLEADNGTCSGLHGGIIPRSYTPHTLYIFDSLKNRLEVQFNRLCSRFSEQHPCCLQRRSWQRKQTLEAACDLFYPITMLE